MYLIIKDNYKIYKYSFSKSFIYKGIKIYIKNRRYYIGLKEGYYFEDGSKTKELHLTFYKVKNNENYCDIEVYIYKDDKGSNTYNLYENKNIIISSNKDSDIVCYDKYLKEYYIKLEDGYLITNYQISVNGRQLKNEKLNNNDIVEYLGIKIIYNDDFLYINSFNCDINISKYDTNEKIINYHTDSTKDVYYLPSKIKPLCIDDIKPFKIVNIKQNTNIIKTIIPSIIMSFSLSIMAINNYLNSSQSKLGKIASIMTPICMVSSTVLLPIIFFLFDRSKNKKVILQQTQDYLLYLNDYEIATKKVIKEYIDDCNSHFFNLLNCKDKIFYATSNSDDFECLSIGKTNLKIKIKYELSPYSIINNKLKQIEDTVNKYDVPIYVDLKKNPIVSIVCKNSKKKYYFNKTLLELTYKHHYADINIAIYSLDSSIINDIYNLPHLFLNGKRLSLNSIKQLQELDQTKLSKPTIVLIYDSCNYVFTNPMIKIVYFSNCLDDLYKNSNVIIEYGNKNYLYDGSKMLISYDEEEINFKKYFIKIGRYLLLEDDSSRSFINMFSIDDIEHNYHIEQKGLRADFAYSNNEIMAFDLHENKQGPHGLIAGSTGAGKSELLVSMLLSLCIRYNPEYLNIILIDYKGGGLKESLSYNNECVPHIVSSLSNLENDGLNRLIIAIRNECINRQLLFKKTSNECGSSIMNIDEFLKNSNSKMSHLLIVVDEFAELKKNNPEQIKELISLSRIGRSLGIHLILATQKPNGVIDDEIFSNSRFKIALRLFEERDSQEIIKTKDAAYLSKRGQFLLRVDESLIMGQSVYSKNDYNNNNPYEVVLLDNSLNEVESKKIEIKGFESECSYYCKKIIEISNKYHYQIKNIQFLKPKPKNRTAGECLILGEVDDYLNNIHYPLSYQKDDCILICSYRKNELGSIINYLCECHRKTIVIGNKNYRCSYISDSLTYDNEEDIIFLFKKLLYAHDVYCTLLIEDYYCMSSYSDSYNELVYKLIKRKDIIKINIIILTSNSQINYKIINSFSNRLLIKSNDQNDITNIFGCKSNYVGDSYYLDDEPKCFVPILQEEIKDDICVVNPYIEKIPNVISGLICNLGCLVGYDEKTREPIYIKDELLITSNSQKLLDLYIKTYPNCFEVKKYNHKMVNNDNSNILWLSSGIYGQRLFVTNLNYDLNSNQGLLIIDGEKRVLRILNE